MALLRLQRLEDALYGKRKPDFKVNEDDWEKMRGSSAFKRITDEVGQQRKIFMGKYKLAIYSLPEQLDDFYKEKIPENFDDIKK